MDEEIMEAIENEVKASFTTDEIMEFKSFKDFFAVIDAQNAYEEEWKPRKYRPYYKIIFTMIRNGEL